MRRTPVALWLSTLVLAGGLAGCLRAEETPGLEANDPTEDPPSSVTVEPEPGVRVAENRGAVRGQVLNDASLPVNGALITIAGTAFYGNTNASGHFLITNIVPGEHVLRAERAGFNAAEQPVTVVAGNVTIVTIFLLPKIDGRAGGAPHVHDFWGDATELILMDHDVDLMKDPESGYGAIPYPVLARAYYTNSNQSNPPGWPIFLPDDGPDGRPPIILPGTGKLVTTFTWSAPDVYIDKLSLGYATAADFNAKMLPPVPSGTPQVLPINATTADTGHQTFTLWRFWVHAGNAVTSPDYKPGFATGKMHVKMVLVKADVFLEPEHPARWAKGDVLTLRNKTVPYRVGGGTAPILLRDNVEGLTLPVGTIVPPGTAKMRIELNWNYPQDAGPLNFEHDLVWRTGDQPPRATPRAAFHSAPHTEYVPGVQGKKVWEIDVDAAWTDTFYQKRSNWLFSLSLKPQPDAALYHVEPRPHDMTLEVTVWKDPAYAET